MFFDIRVRRAQNAHGMGVELVNLSPLIRKYEKDVVARLTRRLSQLNACSEARTMTSVPWRNSEYQSSGVMRLSSMFLKSSWRSFAWTCRKRSPP